MSSCRKEENTTLEDIAGSDEALEFMKTFQGRGVLSDSSNATSPADALKNFKTQPDLLLDLVLAEPDIKQPVFVTFDHRGRLWVVQYNQYPYPQGIKVMRMDQHIRAEFDKVPLPPPQGEKGADKISFFEDTNGDGIFDKKTDAITGLNIATSVAIGRGKIWVLDPPYLLAYPDKDDDGLPDNDPEVHLAGFGIEDTHAVANNLHWGPDGWLYGAQGSTCTATVSSAATKNVHFDGQVIWRYHPESRQFEIFAEGGGNTFDVEIDDKGRVYSGDNGVTRGRYYKQGAYHLRNLGKHGDFTNTHAFGFLKDMELTGDAVRFTHAFIRYQEQGLPAAYQDKMIAINPMLNLVQRSAFKQKGSTFTITDEERILTTDDHWFRPVDITTGPDGAIYIADWYDSRLSHVDPRDTWHKSSGRIYRLSDKKNHTAVFDKINFREYSNDQLVKMLTHPARWYRQQALLEFGNRKEEARVPALYTLLDSKEDHAALGALWAVNLTGGWCDSIAIKAIHHTDPFVRMWAIRLCSDRGNISDNVFSQLLACASQEPNAEVRSQLASSAKRMTGAQTISMVYTLLKNHDDVNDPDIPLQLWWALEPNALSERERIVKMFQDKALWSSQTLSTVVASRLTQRWIMEGSPEDYHACAVLLKQVPAAHMAKPLIAGIQEGLRGRTVNGLSTELVKALEPFNRMFGNETITIALRQKQPEAIAQSLSVVRNHQADLGERLAYIRTFGEVDIPESVDALLYLVQNNRSTPAIRQAALQALARYDDPAIGEKVVKTYPDVLRADLDVRTASLSLLAHRPDWTMQLLNAIDRKTKPGESFIAHAIDKNDVPLDVARQMLLHKQKDITDIVMRLWPDIRPATTVQINQRIQEVSTLLRTAPGNARSGHRIYMSRCSACHKLFGEGGDIGPDLTGYDRKNTNDMLSHIIDPSAYIREGFTVYQVTTTDKRNIVGLLKSRQGNTIVLQSFQGERITLGAEQVVKMEERPGSLMPEGLLNGLSENQIRDLIAYLSQNKN